MCPDNRRVLGFLVVVDIGVDRLRHQYMFCGFAMCCPVVSMLVIRVCVGVVFDIANKLVGLPGYILKKDFINKRSETE